MGGVISLRKGSSLWYVPVFLFVSLAFVWMFAGADPKYNVDIGLNATNVNRGYGLFVFSNWTLVNTSDGINASLVEYNFTSGTPGNYSIHCISGCNNATNSSWTNHSIFINTSFSVGPHYVRVYATSGLLNASAAHNATANTTFYVWGWSNLTNISIPSAENNAALRALCRVTDYNLSTGILDYPVTFIVNGTSFPTTYTNSSGWANFTYITASAATYNFTCSITDNATLYYNDSVSFFTVLSTASGVDGKASSSRAFKASPSAITLNLSNIFNGTFVLKSNAINIIEFVNGTSGISGNYSQRDRYGSSDAKYGAQSGGNCFYLSASQDTPLKVSNETNVNVSKTNIMSFGGTSDVNSTAVMRILLDSRCPPGRYFGNLNISNSTNGTEYVFIPITIDVPVHESNELNATSGFAIWKAGIASVSPYYHSYFFNTTGVNGSSSVTLNLSWSTSSKDIEMFLVDASGRIVERSIGSSASEKISFSGLPSSQLWELRVFGNLSASENYDAGVQFSALNLTSTAGPLNTIEYGNVNATSKKYQNVTFALGNTFPASLALKTISLPVTPSQRGYQGVFNERTFLRSWDLAKNSLNVTFFVPSSAQQVLVKFNWTGAERFNLSIYGPSGSLIGSSATKFYASNVSNAAMEEYISTTSISEGYWTAVIMNSTNITLAATQLNNVTVWTFFNQTVFEALGNMSLVYWTPNFTSINLTLPAGSLSGLYRGSALYETSTGAQYPIVFTATLTASELSVNGTYRNATINFTENIGFNRTTIDTVRQIIIPVENKGNFPLVFDNITNSSFLNLSSNYIPYIFNYTAIGSGTIPANTTHNFIVNITLDTTKHNNQAGLYQGWIFLNSTQSQPFQALNITIRVNLTTALTVDLGCGGCGAFVESSNNNIIYNSSATQNATVKFKAYYINGTEIKSGSNGVLNLQNVSFYIVENSSSYRIPTSGSLAKYNISNGTGSGTGNDIWDTGNSIHIPKVTIPSSSPGGYYNVFVQANHYANAVLLTGIGGNAQIWINNTGLNITPVSSKTISIAEGGNSAFFNVTAVNHGPIGAMGIISMNGSCSYATYTANDSSSTNCYAALSGSAFTFDGAQTAETVDANSTETCWFRWKIISVADVTSNSACTLSVTSSGSANFGDVSSISLTVTDANSTTTTTASAAAASSAAASTTTTTLAKKATIEIQDFPAKLEMEQGSSKNYEIKLKNTGQKDEFSLKLTIEGIDSSWHTVSQTSLDLAKSGEGKFTGKITAPETAEVKDYDIKFTVANSAVTSRAASVVRVLPSTKTKQEINKSYEEYLENYTAILSKVAGLKGGGGNVTTLDSTLTEAKGKIDEAKAAMDKGDYFTASQLLSSAKSLLELAEKQTGTVEFASNGISFWVLVGIAAAAGIGFIVYMLMPPEEYMKGKSGPKDLANELTKSIKEIILRIKIMLKKRFT